MGCAHEALQHLGSENANPPGFVVLGEQGQPDNGPSNWSNRFLPGIYQGCQVALPKNYNPREVIPYLQNAQLSSSAQRRELDLIQRLNAMHLERRGIVLHSEGIVFVAVTARAGNRRAEQPLHGVLSELTLLKIVSIGVLLACVNNPLSLEGSLEGPL